MNPLSGLKLSSLKLKPSWIQVLFLTWGVYFSILLSRIFYWNEQGGLQGGLVNVWSDWSLHVGMATIFAEKSPLDWFAYHPIFADGKMTYPFLANLISGLLMRIGVPIVPAFVWPSIFTFLLMIWGIHRLLSHLLKSEAQAFLAQSLFYLSAGLGFWQYLTDFARNPSLSHLIYPPQEYGRIDELGWYAANFITGMLLPQRTFPLGIAFATLSLSFLFKSQETAGLSAASRHWRLLCGGLLAGILPITHMHSFIFIFVVAGAYCCVNGRKWRELLWFVIPAGVLSTRLYLSFVSGGIQSQSFMTFVPGFMSNDIFQWALFWLKVWGFMLPMAILGFWLFWRSWATSAQAFFVGSFLFFGVANLIQFQPIQWDNSKLFLWTYLGFSALAAGALFHIWKKSNLMAIALGLMLTGTGITEVVRLQSISRHSWEMISKDDWDLAEKVREGTEPLARFLAEPTHNHWVMIRGARPLLLGYTAWAYNFGFKYQQIEGEIRQILKGGPEALELLRKNRVSYVVIGPAERRYLPPQSKFFEKNFPIAFSNSIHTVFDTRSLLAPGS